MTNKKIAICLSGRIESNKSIFEQIKSINNEKLDIDYFIHTWDFDTEQKEIEEIINIINPKKFLIEDISIYDSRKNKLDDRAMKIRNVLNNMSVIIDYSEKTNECLMSEYAPKIYGVMRSANLKRDYEIENNFEYDICVRVDFNHLSMIKKINFNLVIDPNTIYSIDNKTIGRFPYYSINYDFFCCDSQTYDKVSVMYNLLHTFPKHGFSSSIELNEVFEFFRQTMLIKNYEVQIDELIENELIEK